jgi:hypothetical protein
MLNCDFGRCDVQDIPKWKRFELLVKQIQEKISPDSTVLHNEKVMGKTGH